MAGQFKGIYSHGLIYQLSKTSQKNEKQRKKKQGEKEQAKIEKTDGVRMKNKNIQQNEKEDQCMSVE